MIKSNSKIKIAYVAALGHSGSTILDIILGTNPYLIGLGEISTLLNYNNDWLLSKNYFCSCGKKISQCIFWSKVAPLIKKAKIDNKSYKEKYRIILSQFQRIFGNEMILVDSSKEKKYLQLINEINNVELKVIHLIRDVRPWTVSRREKIKRKGQTSFHTSLKINKRQMTISPYLYRLPMFLFWIWYISILRTKRVIYRRGIDSFQVGYEEIAFYPDIVIPRLCNFLEVDYSKLMLDIKKSKSHIAAGNRMRLQNKKRQKFLYDNRWFYNNDWLIPSIVFPNIMKFNYREVYRHTKHSIYNT
jgi:hypothetical protein